MVMKTCSANSRLGHRIYRYISSLPAMGSESEDDAVKPPHEKFVAAFENFPKLKEVPRPNFQLVCNKDDIGILTCNFQSFPKNCCSFRCLGGDELTGGHLVETLHKEEAHYEGFGGQRRGINPDEKQN